MNTKMLQRGWRLPQKVREIHIEFNKDGTGRERASKRVLRAWEKVWRGSAGFLHQRVHKLVDSYNTEEDR